MLRILKLYFAWTVIYTPMVLLGNVKDNVPLLKGVSAYMWDFVYSGSVFHLWYLPALMFALAFVSLIRKMSIRYAIMIPAGLFITGLLLDTYSFLVPQPSKVIEVYSKVFHTTRNGLFFGTVYVYLGYVFSQFDFGINRTQAALGIAISLLLLCAEGILLFEYRGRSETDLMVFALPVAVFTFMFANRQEVPIEKDRLLLIRKLSTTLYCVHPLLIVACAFVSKYIIAIPLIVMFALVLVGSTIASRIIVKLSGKYKLLSYLV